MHISKVDLRLFAVFETIYLERSITAAAGKLHLSQPAVSHALGRLRDLFGDPLFEREGRKMVPTALSRSLIGTVRASLRGLESVLQRPGSFDPAVSRRRFTVAVNDALEPAILPQLAQCLLEAGSGLDVATIRLDRNAMERDLADGTLDLAIDIQLPVSPHVRRVRVFEDPLKVVVRADHPAIGRRLTLSAYLQAGHVQVSSRRSGPSLEDIGLARLGHAREIRVRCQHYAAACDIVQRTDLIATMPLRRALMANQPYGNRVLTLPFALQPLETCVYWHDGTESDPGLSWFRAQVLDAISDNDQPLTRVRARHAHR